MKIAAISSPHDAASLLDSSEAAGYVTFIYHHADPKHELLQDKFLYVHSDRELIEKINLLKTDVTALDMLRR